MTRPGLWVIAVDRIVNGKEQTLYLHADGYWKPKKRGAVTYRGQKAATKRQLRSIAMKYTLPGDTIRVVSAGTANGMPYHPPQRERVPPVRTPPYAKAVGRLIRGYLDAVGITGKQRAGLSEEVTERFGERSKWTQEVAQEATDYVLDLWRSDDRAAFTPEEFLALSVREHQELEAFALGGGRYGMGITVKLAL